MQNIQEAVDYNVVDKLEEIINNVSLHRKECIFYNDPAMASTLASMLEQDVSIKEIALKLGVKSQIVKTHLSDLLALGSVNIYAQIALLKIIAQIGSIEMEKIRAGDILKAVDILLAFQNKGKNNNESTTVKPKASQLSSIDLLTKRIKKG